MVSAISAHITSYTCIPPPSPSIAIAGTSRLRTPYIPRHPISITAPRLTPRLARQIVRKAHTMPIAIHENQRSAKKLSVSEASKVTAEVGGQRNVDRLRSVSRDFKSDTITIPSDAQLLASLQASRGDSIYGEDEDTIALEERIARLTGKEAAMFAASGTMTNQLAIRTHMKQPPHSVIVDYRAHVHKMEAGGIAMFSQATTDQIVPSNSHHLTLEDIIPHLQLGSNIHYRPTKLICLENTLAGTVMPQSEVLRIAEMAKKEDIGLHLDGARIWEVAAKVVEERGMDAGDEESLRVVLTELVEPFDSASLCLSKGIGAPIGSATVGTRAFIEKARWFRKAFGGGVRQSGPMAAAADFALTHFFPKLAGVHRLAKELEMGLRGVGCDIIAPVETNMVFFSLEPLGISRNALEAHCAALPDPIGITGNRLVCHHQTSRQAIQDLVEVIKQMAQEKRDGVDVNAEEKVLNIEERDEQGKELRLKAAVGYNKC